MTVPELNDILALKDWDQICATLEQMGFRETNDAEKREYRWKMLFAERNPQEALQKDKETKQEFYGSILQRDKPHQGTIFLMLITYTPPPKDSVLSFTNYLRLYTNEPDATTPS